MFGMRKATNGGNRGVAGAGRMACWSAGLVLALAAGASSLAAFGTGGFVEDKVPSRLEDAVERAMRGNPDVLLAESMLQQARAELNAVKLRVARDLTGFYAMRRSAEEARSVSVQRLERLRKMFEAGQVSSMELHEATTTLADADARVGDADAQIRYLIGEGGEKGTGGGNASSKSSRRLLAVRHRDEFSERPAACLSTKVVLDFDEGDEVSGRAVVDAIAKEIGEKVGGLRFVTRAMDGDPLEDFDLGPETIRGSVESILQMLADIGEVTFLARDYGFLIMWTPEAREVNAPAIPRDLPYLEYADR